MYGENQGQKNKKIFGTDGIRGVANNWPMTTELLGEVGRAIAYVLGKQKGKNRVLIGKDTRISCYMIESALGAGLNSMGADTMLVGPMPTPGLAFLTHSMRADIGIVISASHNPYQDNGVKIFNRDGFKLPDEQERQIEKKLGCLDLQKHRPTANKIGKAFRIDDARGRYIVFLKATFPPQATLDGLKIVLDCANGAGYKIAPAVFQELGAEVEAIGVSPNGLNINDGCGALYPEKLAAEVKKSGADIGIALDGDADRALFVDSNGQIVDGDHLLAICGENMASNGLLKHNSVVGTSMSNIGLEIFFKDKGIELLRTDVGDRYVVAKMRQQGLNLGGEQSGHIIFLDKNTTGDGIITALQLLAVMIESGKPLSELRQKLIKFPQTLHNFNVSSKPPLTKLPKTTAKIEQLQKELGERGRIVVRYSGTESKSRVMVEGESQTTIEEYANAIAAVMAAEISG